MAKPIEVQKIAGTIQSLNEKINALRTELLSLGPIVLESEDLAMTIENTKLENLQLLKDINQLKTQINELENELKQLSQDRFAAELAEILEADEASLSTLSAPGGSSKDPKKE